MATLRPHRHFNFVRLWKYGFILSAILIVLSIAGMVTSFVSIGCPFTLGTEFSGGTSIQINNVGDMTEDQVREAFESAASESGVETQISSLQTSTSASSGNGFIIKTTDTNSSDSNELMTKVEENLGIAEDDVQIETIGASWGASVILRSILAFLLSCLAILVVIAARYREPRMGVVALITLFHDMIIILGIYAWAGLAFHMEITSDVIAALLAIVGYSLYDTIVSFHRINQNASPQMRMSLKTCANMSVNQIFMRSLNTSITSMLPVLFMLILGTDTLKDFAFAMFCGMVIGIYSTFAISTPVFTVWKARDPEYKKLEDKYPYEVVQSPFTKEMMREARKTSKAEQKAALAAEKEAAKTAKAAAKAGAVEAKAAAKKADGVSGAAAAAAVSGMSAKADADAPSVAEPEPAAKPEPASGPEIIIEDPTGTIAIDDDEDEEIEIELTPEMLKKLGVDDETIAKIENGEEVELEFSPEDIEKLDLDIEEIAEETSAEDEKE